jgi:hypothetical protein
MLKVVLPRPVLDLIYIPPVESVNLFRSILYSLGVFREYYKVVYFYLENAPKVFTRLPSMRQKSFSMQGKLGDFRVFYLYIKYKFVPAIKSSPSRRIFFQNPKKNQIPNHLPRHDQMGKKTISRYCPFKVF